jgi:hypothetical protein
MKPEKQRIAIAKACGWVKEVGVTGILRWRNNNGELCEYLPDYCNDLNAIRDAVITLSRASFVSYCNNLMRICEGDSYFMATAEQSAEAFLKAVGKWEGGADE